MAETEQPTRKPPTTTTQMTDQGGTLVPPKKLMNEGIMKNKLILSAAALLLSALFAPNSYAHCDTLDGPVIVAARKALDKGDVNLVLHWVNQESEPEIKSSFAKTLAVRKLNDAAKELADHYFFETLVRVHRAGEGEPYTGLKDSPAAPAIAAADAALEKGNVKSLTRELSSAVERGIETRFHEALQKKSFKPNDVAAGREFVRAYVSFVHYVEALGAAATAKGHHEPAEARHEH
jgi:hypothetical protein